MKRKIDFVLRDFPGIYRDIFRFYPRRSHVHSFDDDQPKDWSEVYKVYYSWAVIRQIYNDDSSGFIPEESEVLFRMDCDECSRLPDLQEMIRKVIHTGLNCNLMVHGQPAADWNISKNESLVDIPASYEFQVFNNWTNQGIRFALNKEETLKFIDYLERINQYALDHGEGI